MATATLTGRKLAGAGSKYKRVKNDYYATPTKSTESLLKVEKFQGNILEPCCGNGAISKVLKKHGFKVISNDLVNRGYGHHFKDFLNDDFKTYDNVITNPPFKYSKQFIEKSLKITRYKVAMFEKVQLLEGVSRFQMWKSTPLKHIHVFVKRQNPLRNGLPINPKTGKKWASTMCFCWFVWQHGYKGKPTVDWIFN